MRERSDEELLVAVAAGPGARAEFYRRHVAKVLGMGVRRFGNPEDVADFVATVFLEDSDLRPRRARGYRLRPAAGGH